MHSLQIFVCLFNKDKYLDKIIFLLYQSFSYLLHNMNFKSDHLTVKLHFHIQHGREHKNVFNLLYVQMQLKLYWYILIQNLHTTLLVFLAV